MLQSYNVILHVKIMDLETYIVPGTIINLLLIVNQSSIANKQIDSATFHEQDDTSKTLLICDVEQQSISWPRPHVQENMRPERHETV